MVLKQLDMRVDFTCNIVSSNIILQMMQFSNVTL